MEGSRSRSRREAPQPQHHHTIFLCLYYLQTSKTDLRCTYDTLNYLACLECLSVALQLQGTNPRLWRRALPPFCRRTDVWVEGASRHNIMFQLAHAVEIISDEWKLLEDDVLLRYHVFSGRIKEDEHGWISCLTLFACYNHSTVQF
jgi:hypothetical protein